METMAGGVLRQTRRDPASLANSAAMMRRDTWSETLFWMRWRKHPQEEIDEFKKAFEYAKEEWPDAEWVRHANWSIENVKTKLVDEYRESLKPKRIALYDDIPKPKRRRCCV
jgi:hypothetical protein